MIKKQIYTFLLRWISSCLAMYAVLNICAKMDRGSINMPIFLYYLLSGLVFAVVNTVVKPFATLFSLPILLATWGLFTIFVNTGMLALTVYLLPGATISFGGSVAGALLISLINHLLNFIMPESASRVAERGGAQLQKSEHVKEPANSTMKRDVAEMVEAELVEEKRKAADEAKAEKAQAKNSEAKKDGKKGRRR